MTVVIERENCGRVDLALQSLVPCEVTHDRDLKVVLEESGGLRAQEKAPVVDCVNTDIIAMATEATKYDASRDSEKKSPSVH